MHGVLLRSGASESFSALGETGQPVYRAALQLREAIRRTSPQMADHLAIPQSNELGNRIDWYSPIQGDVVPWNSATEEELAPARAQLEALNFTLDRLSDRFLGNEPDSTLGDRAVFGRLLKRVIYFPDESFVYLVNGTPVLTFWGFLHADADRNLEPLHCLYPRSTSPASIASAPVAPQLSAVPPVAAPEPPSASPAIQPWWRRWWWLLPLLLFLLLLPFLLRSCVPNLDLPGLPEGPGIPNLSEVKVPGTPDFGLPSINMPGTGVQLPAGDLTVNGKPVPPGLNGADASVAASPTETEQTEAAAPNGEQPKLPAGEPSATQPPELPSAERPSMQPPQLPADDASQQHAEAEQPQMAPSDPPANEPPLPPTLQADPGTPPALSIPSNAADGAADFLNGNWQAGAGIQDRRTGKPLRLEYSFNDGKGDVTVRRADGISCTGPVSAAMRNGNLSIDSQDQATCSDGSSYDMPQVGCRQGAQNIADCNGRYGSEQFPMSMRQMSE